jgi:hypothetical protein
METLIIFTRATLKKLNSTMTIFASKLLILGLLQIFIGLTLRAQTHDGSLPKAEDLLVKFIEKSGGQQAYDKIQNRLTRSKMIMSLPAISGEVTAYVTKSGLYYISIDSTGIGKIEYGSDGQTVWDINPMVGPKVREGQEKSRFRCLYSLDLPAQWRTAFKKVECTSLDTIEGKPVYKVVAVNQEDYTINYYFDQLSGLIKKIELPVTTLAGQGFQEIFLSNYKIADGILFPHTQRRLEQGREMILNFFSIRHNADIPEKIFFLPENIIKMSKIGK